MPPPPHIKLIAIGNEFRQDDGAGLVVLKKLKPHLPQYVKTAATADVTDLIYLWQGVDAAYLFDAIKIDTVKDQLASTRLYRVDAHAQPLPAQWSSCSTHGFGVADMIELARTLNHLPPQLIVYGIRGQQFGTGCALSPDVERAVGDLVDCLTLEL